MPFFTGSNARLGDYLVLAVRVLASIFFAFGVAKLAGFQFGVTSDMLAQLLGKVRLSQVAWCLFAYERFRGALPN